MREASWLASIRDANVCRVLALCSQEGPLCVLQEYSESRELARVVKDNPNIRWVALQRKAREARTPLPWFAGVSRRRAPRQHRAVSQWG